MSIRENEKALKALDEEIQKSSSKALQLESAGATDIDSFKALQLERQFLANLEKKRLEIRKRLDEEKEELNKLTSRLEMAKGALKSKFEEKAQPFIDRLTDYLEGDLREEFIKIFDELQNLDSEASRTYNRCEMLKGGSSYGLPIVPGSNQLTLNTKVAQLLETWEFKTRDEMIKRSKMTKEMMKK